MDWVFTPSSAWDLSELDICDFDVLEKNQTIDNNSNSGVSDDGNLNKLSEQKQKHSIMSSISSKKPRTCSSEQHISCLVDGCRADLSSCRDYHRRHRVCETHSKTQVVAIGGKEQRFCQQCSRFHSLRDFDEVKRSCRKRLDGHNKRRRKPRPEAMYYDYGSYLTNHRGSELLHFGGSQAYTTTYGGSWEKEKLNQKLQYPVEHITPADSYTPFCSVNERSFRFPFLLGIDSEKVNQPFPKSFLPQAVNTNASVARPVVEPQSALYLLSNSKHTTHHALMSGPTNNLVSFNDSSSQHSGQHLPVQNLMGPNSGHINNQFIGMIHFRTERLLENEASRVLSFSWD